MTDESKEQEFDKQQFFTLFFHPEVPFGYKLTLVLVAGLYLITPLDLLPEPLLGPLGLADDFGIVFAAAKVFTHLANKKLEELHNQRQPQPDQLPDGNTIVYDAQAQPGTPPQAQTHPLPTPRQHQDAPPPTNPEALRDEWHEQLIEQKRHQTDEAFEQMMRERGQDKPQTWDPSHNDPLRRRRDQ